MAQGLGNNSRKQILKDIIRALHNGMPPEAAAGRVKKEIGTINADELAAIEQELITEGVPVEEIQLFCNVHALIFKEALSSSAGTPQKNGNPVEYFMLENIKIREWADILINSKTVSAELLDGFTVVENHYKKKEQILFPYLEKHGFTGPSNVMWSKHDETRGMIKTLKQSAPLKTETGQTGYELLKKMVAEILGMVEKEELILYPTAKEKLTEQEWLEVSQSISGFGESGEKPSPGIHDDTPALQLSGNEVVMPSGTLSLPQLVSLFNTLPVDISFVDAQDRVVFFSEPKDRIFPRPRSVLGREVKNCHPPKSMHVVEKIISSFKDGTKNCEDFWITMKEKKILIRYFAVRDSQNNYLGTLEVSQDITGIQAIKGEKRLLDN
ncbi:MAG: DUF438 domain-containing protein [Spirochaetales bacterium]|nr:DUF438 domain-containing protein [Spirochaetales bacterium]